MPSTPIGTLTRKIQGQPSGLSTIRPPIVGPSVGAIRTGIEMKAEAEARSSGWKEAKVIAVASGNSAPPPMPWISRAVTRAGKPRLSGNRTDAPQRMLAATKMPRKTM